MIFGKRSTFFWKKKRIDLALRGPRPLCYTRYVAGGATNHPSFNLSLYPTCCKMWIFLSNSFLSVVADNKDVDGPRLLVRARRQGHIENVFPNAEVQETPNADYAFRAWITRDQLKQAMMSEIDNMEYTNFKNSIDDPHYHDACLEAWFAMNNFQRRFKR